MRLLASSTALIIVGTLAAQTVAEESLPARAPDRTEQLKILAGAAEFVLNHELSLPNFICTQTTQRFEDSTGKENWRSVDLIVERLTYFEHREDYKVFMVNGRPANLAHEQLGGAMSSGEYGSVLKGIFAPDSDAQFNWERLFTLRGSRMHVFSYRVLASKSDYHIAVPRRKLDLVAGYHGLVFVDAERNSVHRITLHADGIPPDFPVQEVGLVLDYNNTRIGDAEYLLPLEFELRSREGAWNLKNDVTYSDYRKFGADSSITFDDTAPPKSGSSVRK